MIPDSQNSYVHSVSFNHFKSYWKSIHFCLNMNTHEVSFLFRSLLTHIHFIFFFMTGNQKVYIEKLKAKKMKVSLRNSIWWMPNIIYLLCKCQVMCFLAPSESYLNSFYYLFFLTPYSHFLIMGIWQIRNLVYFTS